MEENVRKEKAAIPLPLNIKAVATGRTESLQEEVSKHPNPQSARECLRNETFPVVEHTFKIFPLPSAPPWCADPNPPQGFSSPRAPSLSSSLPSINHSASLCHLSTLPSSPFLKPLATGCKYFRSVLTGTLSPAFQSFTRAWHSWQSFTSTKLSNIQLLQKWQRTVHVHSQPTPLSLLPAKFFRAYDKPTVVSSHF